MNRIHDYLKFAVGFAGLGYIALWPLASVGASGEPFGASLICDGGIVPLNYLCATPHPIELSPALHALGSLSALFVAVQLPLQVLRRSRDPRRTAPATMGSADAIMAPPSAPRRRLDYPVKTVKPRAHFGLRGTPR